MKTIGELMIVGRFLLEVKESKSCEGCFFQSEYSGCYCDDLDIVNYRKVVGECLSKKREDGKSVIFEEKSRY